LLNLHEFARDGEIRTAAQILLDYSFMKFAVASNRGRRVAPFRRQQHRIAHQANLHNYLYSDHAEQVSGLFLSYSGLTGPDEKATPVRLPPSEAFNALIAGTAAYRPPPAAYELALNRNNKPSLHRFFHGTRPRLPASPEDAEAGLEIYYHSPSFLLSAGGQFLNSGYGNDEIDIGQKNAWEQTSRAQATTLIPTRAEAAFHDLVRFEPYPDQRIDPYLKGHGQARLLSYEVGQYRRQPRAHGGRQPAPGRQADHRRECDQRRPGAHDARQLAVHGLEGQRQRQHQCRAGAGHDPARPRRRRGHPGQGDPARNRRCGPGARVQQRKALPRLERLRQSSTQPGPLGRRRPHVPAQGHIRRLERPWPALAAHNGKLYLASSMSPG
jgi:hypothetical protein